MGWGRGGVAYGNCSAYKLELLFLHSAALGLLPTEAPRFLRKAFCLRYISSRQSQIRLQEMFELPQFGQAITAKRMD